MPNSMSALENDLYSLLTKRGQKRRSKKKSNKKSVRRSSKKSVKRSSKKSVKRSSKKSVKRSSKKSVKRSSRRGSQKGGKREMNPYMKVRTQLVKLISSMGKSKLGHGMHPIKHTLPIIKHLIREAGNMSDKIEQIQKALQLFKANPDKYLK